MEKKYVAVTYDDGPNTVATVKMLEVLNKHGIVASFFINGSNVNSDSAKIMQKADAMGCEICNHSKNHLHMSKLTPSQMKLEIKSVNEIVEKYIGKTPKFFRPPFIDVNQTMFDNIDLPFICGQGSCDWSSDEKAEDTARIILDKVQPGDIILMHDFESNSKSAVATDIIVSSLKEKGFEFVTVSKLFEIYGVTPVKNVVYTNVFDK